MTNGQREKKTSPKTHDMSQSIFSDAHDMSQSSLSDAPTYTVDRSKSRLGDVLLQEGLLALGLILMVLGAGTIGYHTLARFQPLDALLNASLVSGGLGPLDQVKRPQGKWFLSVYGILSAFLVFGTLSLLIDALARRYVDDQRQWYRQELERFKRELH